MAGLKSRAKNLKELAENAGFYVSSRPIKLDPKAAQQLTAEAKAHLAAILEAAKGQGPWSRDALEALARVVAECRGIKLGQLAQPLRAALTGSTVSPGVFEVMEVLGRDESLGRIGDCVS
jgi:glutamyl-tRNA synthetase